MTILFLKNERGAAVPKMMRFKRIACVLKIVTKHASQNFTFLFNEQKSIGDWSKKMKSKTSKFCSVHTGHDPCNCNTLGSHVLRY